MNSDLQKLLEMLTQQSLKIAVAESCTGGSLSAALTSLSGSSAYFDRGFITYSNQAKIDMLGVGLRTLETEGAVSEAVVLQMAQGVIVKAGVDLSVAISGIAGPTGATTTKPVGTVCFGFCIKDQCFTQTQHFSGDRAQVIDASVNHAIQTIIHELST